MIDGRKNNGGNSTKSKGVDNRTASKTERQEVYDLLNPYTDEAIKKHSEAITKGERWAIELFYKYQFAMPKQSVDVTTRAEQPLFPDVPTNHID